MTRPGSVGSPVQDFSSDVLFYVNDIHARRFKRKYTGAFRIKVAYYPAPHGKDPGPCEGTLDGG